MRSYQDQLRQQLNIHGWELVEIADGQSWAADEHWTIISRRKGWGLTLVLTFEVDPQWEGPRKKWQGVTSVVATLERPGGMVLGEKRIAELRLHGSHFAEQLDAFMLTLAEHRRSG